MTLTKPNKIPHSGQLLFPIKLLFLDMVFAFLKKRGDVIYLK